MNKIKENKFLKKFISMNFEEKKIEIMRLLKDLVEHSIRAKKLYGIIPKMGESSKNTDELIMNYSDLIYSIEKVNKEKIIEKNKIIEEKSKKLALGVENIKEKLKNEEKEFEENLDDLLKDI